MFTPKNCSMPDMTPLVPSHANLQSFLRGTSTHWGCPSVLYRRPAAPRGFLLRRAAKIKPFCPVTGSEHCSAGKKKLRPRFHPYSLSLPSSKRQKLSNSERRRLEPSYLGQEHLKPQENHRVFCKRRRKRKKFSLDVFALVRIQLQPL